MSAKTDPKNLPPKAAKQANEISKKERRNANLKLKTEAAEKAKAAGLPFDDTIPAKYFAEDFEKAYNDATKSKVTVDNGPSPAEQALGKLPTNDNVPATETRNGEPPTADTSETVVAKADDGLPERLPGESNKKYRQRCHRLAKEAKAAEAPTEAPTEAPKADIHPGGPAVEYDSTVDFKKPETTAENTEEEVHVDDDLVKHGSFEALKKAEEAEEQATAPIQDTPTEAPSEEPAPTPVETKSVENKKPTLTLVPSTTKPVTSTEQQVEQAEAARKFYGSAFTAERSSLLADAVKWLNKAIEFEKDGHNTRADMAFKQALKKEAEAFGSAMAMAA